MTVRAVRILALTLLVLPLFAVVAAADDGPSRVLSATGPVRPAATVDRMVARPAQRAALFIVPGLGTNAADRAEFAAIEQRFRRDHRIVYFGSDGSEYDTYASIDENGRQLRDFVRRSMKRYDFEEAKVLGNSLGGAVGDRAFEEGLSARDGVVAYATIATPHHGSTLAGVTVVGRGVAEGADAEAEFDVLGRLLGHDPNAPAVHALAERRSPTAPKGVRTTTIAAVQDAVIFGWDSHVEGAQQVTLFAGCIEAHGCVLKDERVLDVTEAALRGEPIEHSPAEELIAQGTRRLIDLPHLGGALALASVVVGVSISLRAVRGKN
jgi:hypothetical protein